MQLLSDPLEDRQVTKLVPPPHRPLAHDYFFSEGLPNWQLLRDHLYKEGRVFKADFVLLLQKARALFREEPSLIRMHEPVSVVGDIHGQYYDLFKILQLCESLDKGGKIVFLGDYVDRGAFSVECVLLLLALKVNFPSQLVLLRGNHECRQMTSHFNFRTEVLHKFDQEVYQLVMQTFDTLPLACLVGNAFFLVHGGLSPELAVLSDLDEAERFTQPDKSGLVCDLLWSDPAQKRQSRSYVENQTRGCAYYFNERATQSFLKGNSLISVIRAHQAQLKGYKLHWKQEQSLPLAFTIFSAPNYCDVYKNKGAVAIINGRVVNIRQFGYSPHPYLLPCFMNVFAWSLPFVTEKVCEMFLHLFKGIERERGKLQDQRNHDGLKKKAKAVGKMLKLQKNLTKEREDILQLQGMCPDDRIPVESLLEGARYLQDVISRFQFAINSDKINQKMPD